MLPVCAGVCRGVLVGVVGGVVDLRWGVVGVYCSLSRLNEGWPASLRLGLQPKRSGQIL